MKATPGQAPLPAGATIGILGGGQLGRMLSLAAARLGYRCHIYSDHSGPAFDVAARHATGAFTDLDRIGEFANAVDVVTYEFENVPLAAAAAAERVRPVRPAPLALKVAQDRLEEKTFISRLGIPVAPFAAVNAPADLDLAANAVGVPGILKTRRLGYDGKGQARVANASDLPRAFAEIGRAPAVLEGLVCFEQEVSVLIARGLDGSCGYYDIPVNSHEGGILRRSSVPSKLSDKDQQRARDIARAIAEALGYVGVLAVEMFHVPGASEPLVVNEIAPRVHNSGHWTIDACAVSQFENHIRAVAGLPLGDTARHSDAIMDNLIGADIDRVPRLLREAGTCIHLYGKNEARPGRKMGHVTRLMARGTA